MPVSMFSVRSGGVITGQTMKIFHESLTIVPAKLGNDAGIIGGAALALEKRKASSA